MSLSAVGETFRSAKRYTIGWIGYIVSENLSFSSLAEQEALIRWPKNGRANAAFGPRSIAQNGTHSAERPVRFAING